MNETINLILISYLYISKFVDVNGIDSTIESNLQDFLLRCFALNAY